MTGGSGRTSLFLYTDEDVTDRLAGLLEKRGYKSVSTAGAGRVGLSDEAQLAFATSQGWTILTYNQKDFARLAQGWYAAGREHAGIVLSRQFSTEGTGELLRQAIKLIEAVSFEEMWNTVRNLQSYA